eukprot:827519-Rhodomonas_salina.1
MQHSQPEAQAAATNLKTLQGVQTQLESTDGSQNRRKSLRLWLSFARTGLALPVPGPVTEPEWGFKFAHWQLETQSPSHCQLKRRLRPALLFSDSGHS